MVLDNLRQPALTVEDTLGRAEYVVAVGQQAGQVGGGVGGDVEDVPDVGHHGEGGPLEGKAKGGSVGGNGDVEGTGSLALYKRREGLLTVWYSIGVLGVGFLVSHTFALHSPRVTIPPAQFRTSWAKRPGLGSS